MLAEGILLFQLVFKPRYEPRYLWERAEVACVPYEMKNDPYVKMRTTTAQKTFIHPTFLLGRLLGLFYVGIPIRVQIKGSGDVTNKILCCKISRSLLPNF